jgi:hypothetical protein
VTISKHAIWKSIGGALKNPWVQAVGVPAIGLGVDAAARGMGKLLDVRHKGKAYKKMITNHPHLKKMPEPDTRKYFNTLYRVDPASARDPLVAGAWVNQQHSQHVPGHPHAGVLAGVSDIARIRSQLTPPHRGLGPATEIAMKIGPALARASETSQELAETKKDLKREKFLSMARRTGRETDTKAELLHEVQREAVEAQRELGKQYQVLKERGFSPGSAPSIKDLEKRIRIRYGLASQK